MARYVALLRGIAPTNPNMHQARLVGVLKKLGLENVQAVISSGNVVFEYDKSDIGALEKRMEEAWPKMLGFKSATILRSEKQLKDLVKRDPYAEVDPKLYRLVTFFKRPRRLRIPPQPAGSPYRIVFASSREICSAIDLSGSRTPDFMVWLEREFGKDMTSRTWNTVHRILKKMGTTLALALCLCGAAGTASAQVRSEDCLSRPRPSLGVAAGRSLPYLELASSAYPAVANSSIEVHSGLQMAGRGSLPLTGPLHLRVEAATARWDVRRTEYDSDSGFRPIAETSVDHVRARHLTGAVAMRMGRAPACAHVGIGGGLYSLGVAGTAVRRPGVAMVAGMEIPAGANSAVEVGATIHFVATRDAQPIAMTTVPSLSLLVGWAYRF